MEAILFIGIQGAGKSTFFQQRFFDTHVRINLDMLKTRYREQVFLSACILAKQSFVVDNTNIRAAERAKGRRKSRSQASWEPRSASSRRAGRKVSINFSA